MAKRSDISDEIVCKAYSLRQLEGKGVDKILSEWYPDIPEKVIYAAMKRACDRDLVEYGVSLRFGWLTEKGTALIVEEEEST